MNPELARVIYPLHIKEVDDRLLVDKYALPAQHVTDEESWDFHYAFETIHPFIDGNGRTGRLWLNAIRIQCGLPWITVMYNDRYQYYDAISEWEHLNGRTKWKLG
jgi:fido (protein-threonine AMPylation protein)